MWPRRCARAKDKIKIVFQLWLFLLEHFIGTYVHRTESHPQDQRNNKNSLDIFREKSGFYWVKLWAQWTTFAIFISQNHLPTSYIAGPVFISPHRQLLNPTIVVAMIDLCRNFSNLRAIQAHLQINCNGICMLDRYSLPSHWLTLCLVQSVRHHYMRICRHFMQQGERRTASPSTLRCWS